MSDDLSIDELFRRYREHIEEAYCGAARDGIDDAVVLVMCLEDASGRGLAERYVPAAEIEARLKRCKEDSTVTAAVKYITFDEAMQLFSEGKGTDAEQERIARNAVAGYVSRSLVPVYVVGAGGFSLFGMPRPDCGPYHGTATD